MFHSTFLGHLWRPILVFTLGAALGTTLLAPVAAAVRAPEAKARTAAIYTRYASCAGVDFFANNSATPFSSSGTERFGQGYFICNPNLPNGAQVIRVTFTVRDDLNNAQISGCEFVSSDLRALYATTYYVHASVPDTGIAAAPGVERLSSGTVFFPIIDNTINGYWLQCGSLETSSAGVGIYGAEVKYKITATNG